jgi:uncharacterized protein YabN with tetrapyrrole methylase and pyrophosphatase domain
MKLSLIGRGVRPQEHLTLAALRAIKDADVVLGIEPDDAAWHSLSEEFSLPPIRSLEFLYRDGVSDEINYKAFYSFIIESCQHYSHIALVVAGHPRMGVTIAQWLSKSKQLEHIELNIIEGVSSFDTMINDLACDPLERGTAILDANRLLLFKYRLEPSVDTFIYHVSSVGNVRTDYVDSCERNQVHLLAEYLQKYFSTDKKIVLCKASNISGLPAEYSELTLGTLVENASRIDTGTTLFIPADAPKSINSHFLSMLRSAHASSQIHSC